MTDLPQRGAASHARSGFVLAEVLLALVLLSVTLTLFGAAFQLGQRLLNEARARDHLAAHTAGIETMSRLLSRTMAIESNTDKLQRALLFDGRPDRVAFVTLSQGDTHTGGLLAVLIRFNRAAGSNMAGEVDIGTAMLPPGGQLALDRAGGGRAILLRNVHGAEFEYYGAKGEGHAAMWHRDWHGATLLPQLVSLRTRLRLNRRDHMLEFAFRMRNG
ncbi:MAG: hypothetical protein IT536_19310 [Hyphomicrobiales bacterium]|nr:hypothetical protein [Hyphomicrobiales bacterium]